MLTDCLIVYYKRLGGEPVSTWSVPNCGIGCPLSLRACPGLDPGAKTPPPLNKPPLLGERAGVRAKIPPSPNILSLLTPQPKAHPLHNPTSVCYTIRHIEHKYYQPNNRIPDGWTVPNRSVNGPHRTAELEMTSGVSGGPSLFNGTHTTRPHHDTLKPNKTQDQRR